MGMLIGGLLVLLFVIWAVGGLLEDMAKGWKEGQEKGRKDLERRKWRNGLKK